LGEVHREGLLAQHMLAGRERLTDLVGMRGDGTCDVDGIDPGIGEDRVEVIAAGSDVVSASELLATLLGAGVNDRRFGDAGVVAGLCEPSTDLAGAQECESHDVLFVSVLRWPGRIGCHRRCGSAVPGCGALAWAAVMPSSGASRSSPSSRRGRTPARAPPVPRR